MFKQDSLRPNLLGLISADARKLGMEAFYPPLNSRGVKYLASLKKQREDFMARYNKSVSFDIPDEDDVKYKLYTDAEVEPPYYRATE